ncbi:MAG TPA: metal-sensing transcriptional repressor [Candidatus Woesebacteria bacterium]|nr:metal-sensing transcriptional repressor [Candidatus Woesebacteria bacterium]HNS94993.1 metal-sensing transcriptional repressor [Candidatus Woesebacteria bacterium]
MKIQKKVGTPPAVLAVRKSMGTLDKVSELIAHGKNYGAVIQQIDAAIGLAQSAKKVLMNQHLEQVVKQSKNNKRLVTELQKLYTYTTK